MSARRKTPRKKGGGSKPSSDTVRVAVRVRPFNEREIDMGAERCIFMQGESTTISDPTNPDKTHTFTFDFSYDSFDKDAPNYASQATVFNDLGISMVDQTWQGFNTSIFAYGQTGAGKSYSMMGYGPEKGIIPLGCEELFNRIHSNTDPNITYTVEVSYLEVYNEAIKDLLTSDPKRANKPLQIRENKAVGVYVEDLTKIIVHNFAEIEQALEDGNACRSVAQTKMNATSSRSHSVFTVNFTMNTDINGVIDTTTSRVDLIDLAGSERQQQTEAEGERLKEACAINKSLSALGNVISALADRSKGINKFVPYRDSVLTRLLANSLGGNAKTIMIAALSPASGNYDETLSTLKYADRAKRIVNKAQKNTTPKDAAVAALTEEIQRLKAMLEESGGGGAGGSDDDPAANLEFQDMQEQLTANQKLIDELTLTVEERERRTTELNALREAALEDMGISIGELSSAFGMDKSAPHLVNLNADPMMSENLVYFLKPGITRVGKENAEVDQDIVLGGFSVQPEHCTIRINEDSGEVLLIPIHGARTFVNGTEVTEPTPLVTGSRIILGKNHIFRYNNPPELERIRAERAAAGLTEEEQEEADWAFAMKELAMARGQGGDLIDPDSESGLILRLVEETDEANDMCELLGKKMIYSVELSDNEKTGKREVGIRATNLLTDTTKFWSVDTFEHKYNQMQALFEEYTETHEWTVTEEDDPFYDPPSDQLIGSATISLRPLLEGNTVSGWFPITFGRYQERRGELNVVARLTSEGRPRPGSDVTVSIAITAARELKTDFHCGLFARFHYPEGSEQVTDRCPDMGNLNPIFRYKEEFPNVMGDEFTQEIRTRDLVVEVWGHENVDDRDPDVLIAKLNEQEEEIKVLRKHFELINRQQADEINALKRKNAELEANAYALIKDEVLEYQAKKAKLEAALKALRHSLPTFQAQLVHLLESGKLADANASD